MRKKEMRIEKFTIDPSNPPPPSHKQRREMAALAKMSDKDIDYSDIPPIPTALLRKAGRRAIQRRVERQ